MMKQSINNSNWNWNSTRHRKDIKKTKKTPPTPSPPYAPPPLLTKKEIETEGNKENNVFNKTSSQMSKEELDAANESADQKNN